MLRFTKQVDYGLMAMQYIAEHQGGAPVGVKRIADEFGIPVELLAKVLQRLAKGGLMVAQRGPCGGYRLADHGDCVQASRCTLRKPARRLQAAITDLLDTMTLAEFAGDDVPAALAAQR